jgi:apolipoprotein N-acyltransferase
MKSMMTFALLTALGVAGYIIAFPPVDFAPAGLIALICWALAFRQESLGWIKALIVYLAGVVTFAAGCAWLLDLNPLFPFFMAVFEGLALLFFCAVYRMNLRWAGMPIWLALPLAWVAVEYLRSVFPLDGFPWLILGYTLWKVPILIQIADLFGVYGVSFLMVFCAGVAAAWIVWFRAKGASIARKPVWGTVIFPITLALVIAYGIIRPGSLHLEEGPMAAAVQGNIPQHLKDNSTRAQEVFDRYKQTTRRIFEKAEGETPSLVVWPETLFPFPLGEGEMGDDWFGNYGYEEALIVERRYIVQGIIEEILAPHGAWFLTGIQWCRLRADGRLEKRNSAYLYDPSGERKDVYHKTILVPGGEYLPFIEILPFREKIEAMILEGAGFLPDLEPGFGPQVMQFNAEDKRFWFGVQICYENIYGDYCRRFIDAGADFLINLSNEGWFRSQSEFDQMLAMSVFRAVETRRSLFRSTNTGISCIIGPRGGVPPDEDRIMEHGSDSSVQGVLVKRVPICRNDAVYTRVGDLFSQVIFFAQIILVVSLLFKKLWVKRVSLR